MLNKHVLKERKEKRKGKREKKKKGGCQEEREGERINESRVDV